MDDKLTIKTRKLRYHKKSKSSKHDLNQDAHFQRNKADPMLIRHSENQC